MFHRVREFTADFRSRKFTHTGQGQGYSKTNGRLRNHGIGRHPFRRRLHAGWDVRPLVEAYHEAVSVYVKLATRFNKLAVQLFGLRFVEPM